jgi:hypothetical protein
MVSITAVLSSDARIATKQPGRPLAAHASVLSVAKELARNASNGKSRHQASIENRLSSHSTWRVDPTTLTTSADLNYPAHKCQ